MKAGIIRGTFDPITASEVAEVLRLRRENGWHEVFLEPEEAGSVSSQIRLAFLKKAMKPFRHVIPRARTNASADAVLGEEFARQEKEVRGGRYFLAARGIRRDLAEEGMYLEETVRTLCNPHRALHSLSVAEVCVKLAGVHRLDTHRAWLMGCMHDLTKAWSDERGRQFLEVYEPDKTALNPKIYHSYTAPVFLRTVMGVQDPLILGAIRAHTLGTCRNDYDRILYIADKIEPTRGYDVTEEMNLAQTDLQLAFELVFREAKEYRERNMNG